MAYNMQALLQLDINERLNLVQELWDSIDEELLPVSEELRQLAEDRYMDHLKNPNDILSFEELKERIQKKHGL